MSVNNVKVVVLWPVVATFEHCQPEGSWFVNSLKVVVLRSLVATNEHCQLMMQCCMSLAYFYHLIWICFWRKWLCTCVFFILIQTSALRSSVSWPSSLLPFPLCFFFPHLGKVGDKNGPQSGAVIRPHSTPNVEEDLSGSSHVGGTHKRPFSAKAIHVDPGMSKRPTWCRFLLKVIYHVCNK